MYFQAAYIDGDFWKTFWSVSGFVKVNLTFGLLKELPGLRVGYLLGHIDGPDVGDMVGLMDG